MAWPNLTTLPAQHAPTASEIAALYAALNGLTASVQKTVDETVNNSATLQNDDELVITLPANSKWRMWSNWRYSTNTTANVKFAWTYPSGLTMRLTETLWPVGDTVWKTFPIIESDPIAASGSVGVVKIDGLITVAGTGGALQVQWAQNTANASNTIVQAGSDIVMIRVG